MYNWLLSGSVVVDSAIAITAFIILMAVACLTGYVYGFDDGYGRVKWCGSCKTYHSNQESCSETKGIFNV